MHLQIIRREQRYHLVRMSASERMSRFQIIGITVSGEIQYLRLQMLEITIFHIRLI